MKRLLTILILLFVICNSYGQTYPLPYGNLGSLNVLTRDTGGLAVRQMFVAPVFADTNAANLSYTKNYPFSEISTNDGKKWYRYNNRWIQLTTGSGTIPTWQQTLDVTGGSILTNDNTITGHYHLDIQGLSHYESYVSSLAGNNTLEIDSNFIDLFDGVHHNELLFNNNGISINSTKGWMVNGDYGTAGYVLTSNGSSPPTWNVLSSNQNFANTDLIQTADRYYNSHKFNNIIDSSRNFNIITQDFDDQGDGNAGFLSYNTDRSIYGQVAAFQGQSLLTSNNIPNGEFSSFSANVTNPTQGSGVVFASIRVDSGTRVNNIFITPDTSSASTPYNFLTLIGTTLYRVPLSTLGAGTVTSVAGHSPVSGAVTLSILTNGFGILGTAYNGSANQLWKVDTSSTGLSTLFALNDSAGVLRALSNTKQIQLNGTGYVKQSGTSTSYVSSIPISDLAHSSITFNNSFGFNWNSGNLGVLGSSITGTVDTTKIQTAFAGFDTASVLRTLINTKGVGTITGVTAGIDLTGGGISGTVTLNADTTTGATKLATQGFVTRGITAGNYFVRSGDSASYVNLPNEATLTPYPISGVNVFDSSGRFSYRNSLGKTISFSTSLMSSNSTAIDSFENASGIIPLVRDTTGGVGTGFFATPFYVNNAISTGAFLKINGSTSLSGNWLNTGSTGFSIEDRATSTTSNTSYDGIILRDSTVASTGNQKYSPRISFTGHGWNNVASASQSVLMTQDLEPVQNSSGSPDNYLVFRSSINNSAPTTLGWLNRTSSTNLSQFVLQGAQSGSANDGFFITDGAISMSSWQPTSPLNVSGGGIFLDRPNNNFKIAAGSSYNLTFSYVAQEAMRIARTSANVLIGTTTDITPSVLTVASSTKGVTLTRQTTSAMNSISSPNKALMSIDTTITTPTPKINTGSNYWATLLVGDSAITSLTTGMIPVWNATNKRYTPTVLTGGNGTHTIFIPTTGGTVALVNNQNNIINPSGALVALTVTLPSSPNNNDVLILTFEQAVTTVTYSGGTVAGSIVSPVAGSQKQWVYDSGTATWY